MSPSERGNQPAAISQCGVLPEEALPGKLG
jgi:hypothetical protein